MNCMSDRSRGLDVSRETEARLREYQALVIKWTGAINLVAESQVAHLWERHILDSAQLYPLAPSDFRAWVDIGSGGGFPGLVAAIMAAEFNPDATISLIESDQRKTAFLVAAASQLRLKAKVICGRAETLEPQKADVVSARAVAPLVKLISFANRHLTPDGTALFPKGQHYPEEIMTARRSWAFDVDLVPSLTDPMASIVKVWNIRRA